MTGARGTWLVGALIAAGALVFSTGPLYRVRTWWPHTDPLSADVAVVTVQLIVSACAVAALVAGGRWRQIDPRLSVLAVALVAWTAVGAAWSANPSTTLREALMVGATLVAGAAAAVAASEQLLVLASWIGVHIGLGWSAVLIISVQPGTQDTNGDWTGVYFNPNALALVAAFGVLLSTIVALQFAGHRWRAVAGVVAAAAIVADLWLIIGTGALTPLFGLLVAAAVVALAVVARRAVGPHGQHRRDARWVAAASGGVLVALGLIAWWSRGFWLSSLGRAGDLTGRTAMWEVALDWVGDRPILGHGYLGVWFDPEFAAEMLAARGQVLGSTHNTFIEILLGAGIIGLVLLLAMYGLVWVAAGARALDGRGLLAAWPLAMLTFILVENLAETLWVAGQLSVAAFGVVAAVSARTPAEPVADAPDHTSPGGAAVVDDVGVERRR